MSEIEEDLNVDENVDEDPMDEGAAEAEAEAEAEEAEASDAEAASLRLTCKLLKSKVSELQARLDLAAAQAHAAEQKLSRAELKLGEARSQALHVEGHVLDLKKALYLSQQRVQELEGQVAAGGTVLQGSLEERRKMADELAAHRGKFLSSAMNKPPTFDGKGIVASQGGLQVEDWWTQVVRYTTALQLTDAEAVMVGASLLRDEASRAWSAEEAVLQGNNQPLSLPALKTCLLNRFTPAATVHQARMQLDALCLNSKRARGLASYVAEFDRLCMLIPDLSAAERQHRFMAGIRRTDADLAQKCCTDPVTSVLYTDFNRMRTATLNVAAHAAEFLNGISSLVGGHTKKVGGFVNYPKRSREELLDSGGGGSSGAGSSKAAAGPSRRERSRERSRERQAGNRSKPASGGKQGGASGSTGDAALKKAISDFCRTKGLCFKCHDDFEPGHKCSKPQVEKLALPPGMSAPK